MISGFTIPVAAKRMNFCLVLYLGEQVKLGGRYDRKLKMLTKLSSIAITISFDVFISSIRLEFRKFELLEMFDLFILAE